MNQHIIAQHEPILIPLMRCMDAQTLMNFTKISQHAKKLLNEMTVYWWIYNMDKKEDQDGSIGYDEETMHFRVYDYSICEYIRIHKSIDERTLTFFLTYGADINHNFPEHDALRIAVENRDTKAVELLCKYGANINNFSQDNFNCLVYAACNGYGDIFSCLLEYGANPKMVDISLNRNILQLMANDIVAAETPVSEDYLRIIRTMGMYISPCTYNENEYSMLEIFILNKRFDYVFRIMKMFHLTFDKKIENHLCNCIRHEKNMGIISMGFYIEMQIIISNFKLINSL